MEVALKIPVIVRTIDQDSGLRACVENVVKGGR
jgi:hypothetical protein